MGYVQGHEEALAERLRRARARRGKENFAAVGLARQRQSTRRGQAGATMSAGTHSGGDVEDGMGDREQPAVDRAKVQAKVVSRRGAVQIAALARPASSGSLASASTTTFGHALQR